MDFNVKLKPEPKPETISVNKNNLGLILGITIPIAIFAILLIVALAFLWRRNKRQKEKLRNLTGDEVDQFFKGSRDSNINSSNEVNVNKEYDLEKYEIPMDKFTIDENKVIGSGQYGLVLRGSYRAREIAVKTTKSNVNVDYFKAFLTELKLMSQIGTHENIVEFIGASTENIHFRRVYILLEMCPMGSIHSYLRKYSGDFENLLIIGEKNVPIYQNSGDSLNTYDLLNWSQQIAQGMEYLAEKKVIHGDLAARNVLLKTREIVKITDFGLSRQMYNYSLYIKKQKQPLPWAWLALESIKYQEFSTDSDCWSFGVTIWELFSLGEKPHSCHSFSQEFIKRVDAGMRLEKPAFCNEEIYEIMVKCWNKVPKSRPSFQEMKEFFEVKKNQFRPEDHVENMQYEIMDCED